MRLPLLALVFTVSICATASPGMTMMTPRASSQSLNPCSMEPLNTSRAWAFMGVFLSDTGLRGEVYEDTRTELGVTGVRLNQVMVVQDSIKCHAAITSWQRLYASFGVEDGVEAARINNGLLFRLTPNRFILATPMINKFSGLTYLALDSNAVVIRNNL